jgi:Flp pilus assembly protein TadD
VLWLLLYTNFRKDSLIIAAQRATQDNRPDDALAYPAVNLEYFPTSPRSHQAISQAYSRKNNRENAIKSMQRAMELDPANGQYKNQLNQLQNPPATQQ